jgi:hypothetical protein
VLLPGTVRANLELFGPLTDLEKACRDVGFDEVLATLPAEPRVVLVTRGDGSGIARFLGDRLAARKPSLRAAQLPGVYVAVFDAPPQGASTR